MATTIKTLLLTCLMSMTLSADESRPNIVLVMADDMGWGQTGYYNHPVLKTPNLDAMVANGLRFDRFYAGAPNCSPTRATVMTGRSNDRTGVHNHGYPLRLQERTVAQALRDAGYATGHFGKWHLNGLRGPGAPILASDARHPGVFGFDEWLSVTNFFDRNPLLSHRGEFIEFEGDSSDIIVSQALEFIRRQVDAQQPSFTVIWYGSPHSPWIASDEDGSPFTDLDEHSKQHYGELVAMDRSIGTLRQALRDLGIADNTLVWFNSDNGGLPKITPDTVGGLRGFKNTVYEGGLRVPAIIEWPTVITQPRVTEFPAVTMDIFPTLTDITGLPDNVMLQPQDGLSLRPLFREELNHREKPIPFRHTNRAALIDNEFKLLTLDVNKGKYELFHISDAPRETTDVSDKYPEVTVKLRSAFEAWAGSIENSIAGMDYPEGTATPPDPAPRDWSEVTGYQPYLDEWKNRPEFSSWLTRQLDQ
ncbi:MAG: sulfatase-like hydrolase/transferase [Planctomycetaceae bacterium]|nr:sulfatase-like hydrolase/transferase [Planctomycetaceae bacterium]